MIASCVAAELCARGPQEVTTHDREIVARVSRALAERLGPARFDAWFGPGVEFRVAGTSLRALVPNAFIQDWLRGQFRGEVAAAAREATDRDWEIEFLVREPAARENGHAPARVATDTPAAVDAAPTAAAPPSEDAERSDTQGPRLRLATPPDETRDRPPRAAPRPAATLDRYVVGSANRLAHASALGVIERPGLLSPLVVHGPTGVGKTHLLQAIAAESQRRHRHLPAICVTAEQFTTDFLEALQGSGLPSFRRKYRGVGLLAIDDVQFFAGKRATQGELLHTIDALLRDGRQLVFAADRPPAEMPVLGPELKTRLLGGLVCGIDLPDFETRLGIVTQVAAELRLPLGDEVARYVATHFRSHARELAGAVKRLHLAHLADGRPLDQEFAERALAELVAQQVRLVRLPDIEKAVCDVFGLEPRALQSDRKAREVAGARALAMWLARRFTRSALSEIGRYFGGRSHSTVIAAERRVENWVARRERVAMPQGAFEIDDAIRRVERALWQASA